MSALRSSGVAVALLLAQAGMARAAGPTIEHSAIKCIVAGKYRKMPARFAPPEVAQPRVYFRPEGIPSWYYVEMKPEVALGHVGVLPKPTKKLVGKHIEYYLEAASKDFDTGRTPEYDPLVVAKESECRNDPVVAYYSSEPPAAVFPSVPEGFALGGGVAGGTVAAIVGGAAAAGTAVVLATKGDDEPIPTPVAPTQPPITAPPITVPPTTPPSGAADVACQADPRQGRAPLQVKFNAQASGGNGVFNYAWTFGDGGTSTQVNPSHTYATPGVYEARVVATSGDRTASCARVITVLASAFRLNVSPAGTGTGRITGDGIDCPGDCTEEYAPGTAVTLTAAATAGSTFAGWGGDCSGTGACSLVMDGDHSVSATFNAASFVLNVTLGGSGNGSVTGPGIACPGDCSESYTGGTVVTLTAVAGANSTFAGWGGDCAGSTGLTCNVTMSAARNVSAAFNLATFPLTVTVGGSGTGTLTAPGINCPGDCNETYNFGTPVALTATAGPGSSFGFWGGDCTGTTGLTCTLTMNAAHTASASFSVPTFRLTLNVQQNATVIAGVDVAPSPFGFCDSAPAPGTTCVADYAPATSVTLVPVDETGDHLFWSGDCASVPSGASCVLSMTANRNVGSLFGFAAVTQTGPPTLVSRLEAPSARAQATFNDGPVAPITTGVQSLVVSTVEGQNRFEAQVSEGAKGMWTLDLSGIPGLERGSLRVLAGNAVAVAPDSIVFRLSGKAGERIALAFAKR